MKVVFISNFYTHHQSPFCEEMFKAIGTDFAFISTSSITTERKQMKWGTESASFVYNLSAENENEMHLLIERADCVIIGSAPWKLVESRLKSKKLVFRYSERIFKNGYNYLKWLPRVFLFWNKFGKYSSLYLLSASAYTTVDYAIHGAYRGKSYKWGYFPATKKYDLQYLMSKKERNTILWCGRFIDFKHPEWAISLAEKLKKDGYRIQMKIVGNGYLENEIKQQIQQAELEDCVSLLGSMTPEQVRSEMETAGIYIFTSDFREGWGAVLNESMNSGCAVVASHAIGSVPYMIKDKTNGLIYKNGDFGDFFNKVKCLLNDHEYQERIGLFAYKSIVDLWNAELAANRFLSFVKEIEENGACNLFEDGPCSRAKIIKNNWFRG